MITRFRRNGVGNRTSSHLATGQVHDAANRLLEDSQFTYAYDANGNLASKTDRATAAVTTYDWDVEDHLVAVHTTTQTVTLRYDPMGRRIEKAASVVTRYLYDQEDIVEELDGANVLRLRYTHGPGIDEPLSRRDATNTVAYYAADGLGSVTDTTNASGQASVTRRYDSYGNVLVGGSAGGYGFTGREWDPETGLFYYRARYYDAAGGMFLSVDPAGIEKSGSYQYVGNNPTGSVDPLGLYRCVYFIAEHYMECFPDQPGHPAFASGEFTSGTAQPHGSGPKCADCPNNPARVDRPFQGPTPPGYYSIGPPHAPRQKNASGIRRDLEPDPPGRDSFQLHACRLLSSPWCSTGCIATTPATFMRLNYLLSLEEGLNILEVHNSGDVCGSLTGSCQ